MTYHKCYITWDETQSNELGRFLSYDTAKEAIIESKRLADKHPGEKFYVLKTIACYAVQPNEVSEVEFEDDCFHKGGIE